MVAPNGARPTKKDHAAVPMSLNEIVNTGKACFEAGAEAIHFHTRNDKGEHVLDSGLCKETLSELQKKVPKMHLQITTEAIGKYSPEEMRKLAYEVMPPGISIGIREMIPSRNPSNEDIKIYQKLIEADTKIQHICYEPEDIDLLSNLLNKSKISKDGVWCMFVIGHYSGKISDPKKISLFIEKLKENEFNADWAVCAFSKEEISCLKAAINLGGKIRVGFENSFLMPDGSIAPNNETKVKAANNLFD
tara:strand:- start:851 stop:1594 length:744 start_codon:yes stop_codon:yes gene_type:complete